MTWRDVLFRRVGSIGGELEDPDLRTQKFVTVSVSLFAVLACIIWTLIALSIGEVANVYAIIVSGSLILMLLAYLSWSRNYRRYRTGIYAVSLLAVVILHFSIGGFTGSKSLT